ncbi:MAG TPA: TAXI family TRAP transporter solute-binding subunit [Stellaceae bacterium]|nr:TAXI family TRAP transporter solute-binding subunit [Stellaceae bacterium]
MRPSHYLLISGAIIVLLLLGAGGLALLYPAVPREIVMATGSEGGGYAAFGERYRQILARQGITLTLLHTRGSIENLSRLHDPDSGTSIALVQGGLARPQQFPNLVSLGTVSVEPLWVFYRPAPERLDQLKQLRGMRVAIGPQGSGMHVHALALLALNGIDDQNTTLLPLTPAEAAKQLLSGEIQAAMLVDAAGAPAVQQLLGAPGIQLLSLRQADAYVARLPYLSRVVLPAGFVDLAHGRPAADVEMVAVKTNLVVLRDLPSPIQYLLLEAATKIHSQPGVFQSAGEFPAAEETDLPLSADALQFYKSGPPLLQRELPLWLAVLIKQLAIILLPIVAVGYPLLHTLPAAKDWWMRRRVHMLYGELKLLERELKEHAQEQRAAELSDLTRLEYLAAHLQVPNSYAHLLYALQQDIDLVRARVDRTILTES